MEFLEFISRIAFEKYHHSFAQEEERPVKIKIMAVQSFELKVY